MTTPTKPMYWKSFGPKRLKRIRQFRDIKQLDLCKRAKISQSMLAQIESGVSTPSVDTLFDLLAALKVEPETFFRRDLTWTI